MAKKKIDNVDLLLSKLDKTQLAAFIRNQCIVNERFQDEFLALGVGKLFKPSPSIYASRVEDLIDEYSGRCGYINYRSSFEFNRAVTRILDEADEAMENGKWDVAVAVLTGVASVSKEIITGGDDSAGELGALISSCFDRWYELCVDYSIPDDIKTEIFELALSRFNDKDLEGWDWWWNWIEMAITLADTPERQDRVIEALDAVKYISDNWHAKFCTERAQRYKLEMMSRRGSEEEQIKFMYDNVANPDFRQRLFQIAWDKSDYDEVLRLAKEGVNHDAQYAGLVNDWHKWEYKVYCTIGDIENKLRLARYFFFNGADWREKMFSMESMYAIMKELVPQHEWTKYLEELINEVKTKKDEVRLLFIYTEEQKWQDYMDLIRNKPSTYIIDEAPDEVKELFSEEIIKIYGFLIRDYFQYASKRSTYCHGVELLRKLIGYGGKKEAEQIVSEQKSRTPRRPALIDELSKL